MNTTIRGHNLRVTVVMALLAVLLLLAVALVFALRPAPTTSDRDANLANHAMSAYSTGGSISTHDPYIERHAEVVERLGNGSLR
jgi:Trk-type K+ transport system membrane component